MLLSNPLRERPHLFERFGMFGRWKCNKMQAQSGAGRCEANAWATDVSSWLIGPQKGFFVLDLKDFGNRSVSVFQATVAFC